MLNEPQPVSTSLGTEVAAVNLSTAAQFDDIPIKVSKQDFNLDTRLSPEKHSDNLKSPNVAANDFEDTHFKQSPPAESVEIQLEPHLQVLLGLLNSYVSECAIICAS